MTAFVAIYRPRLRNNDVVEDRILVNLDHIETLRMEPARLIRAGGSNDVHVTGVVAFNSAGKGLGYLVRVFKPEHLLSKADVGEMWGDVEEILRP